MHRYQVMSVMLNLHHYKINMKAVVLILIVISLLISPVFVLAGCNKSGVTVVFVNGMFTFSEADAKENKDLLEQDFKYYTKRTDVNFITGYNPSHAGGMGDMVNAVAQAYRGGYMDYDLTNILKQIHGDLKTQKILLIGHSQGTFYTNAAYDYLVANGVDKNSIPFFFA